MTSGQSKMNAAGLFYADPNYFLSEKQKLVALSFLQAQHLFHHSD